MSKASLWKWSVSSGESYSRSCVSIQPYSQHTFPGPPPSLEASFIRIVPNPRLLLCCSQSWVRGSLPESQMLLLKSLLSSYLASPPGRRERRGQAHLCEALLQAEAEAGPKPRAKLEPENLRALSMAPPALSTRPRHPPPALPAPLQPAQQPPGPHPAANLSPGTPSGRTSSTARHRRRRRRRCSRRQSGAGPFPGRPPGPPASQRPANPTGSTAFFSNLERLPQRGQQLSRGRKPPPLPPPQPPPRSTPSLTRFFRMGPHTWHSP